MKRTALAVFLTIAFATTTLARADNPPAAPPPQEKKADKKPQPPGAGIRKLSRRERKDKIAKLDEKFRQFLIDVEPIMLPTELDTFLVLETDPQREIFVEEFWHRRDVYAGTTNRAFKDQYYDRLEDAKTQFKQVSSDRARMYLLHGAPAEFVTVDCSRLLQPIQIWKYLYVPGLGHNTRLLFYIPRNGNDYVLWTPSMDTQTSLAELVAQEQMAFADGDSGAVDKVFNGSASPYTYINRIQVECKDGDEILKAIGQMQQNRTDIVKVFEPPEVNPEDVRKILRSVVLANPDAPKLTAEFAVKYPTKQGQRTDAEMTILVPRSQIAVKEVGGAQMYSLDVVGEVLRDEQLWEKYRYRFDYPSDIKDEKLPIVIDRLLRPNDYRARIKVTDANSGAEVILEQDLTVPEIFDTPATNANKQEATTTVTELKKEADAKDARLRIVPPNGEELVNGIQKIETLVTGDAIKGVEFWLDGKKVAVRRSPPYTLDLDFGNVPQSRRIRVVGLDSTDKAIAGDDVVVNTGTDPFRVRILSPRFAPNLRGRTRVEVDVKVPEGKELDNVELYWNETKVATMYDPPFVQTVTIPADNGGVGYIRAVAKLKEETSTPIEDVVMINTPAYMEELNVHLVELPTTVLVNGKPQNTLDLSAFKVFDEGKPVKIEKFEQVKNLPLSIGLAIDTSGSMQPRMDEAQKAAAQFFDNVMKKGDRAFVVAFDSQPQVVQKWSPRVADIHAGLAKLRAEEYTAMYDAVVFSLYNFLGMKGQKALVLLSDGKDTASKFSFEQALEYARRAAVPIYAIGIGIRPSEVDVKYKLNKFCAETGGNAYYIEHAEDLGRIYTDIQNELRSQYILGFYPPNDVKPGSKWREVNVQVGEGKAKTIRGYYP
ncbi:MAG TPA: VWA domain-containing protein [Thermoanaerobaculia bacterium]|nr:VWA domain-containing protein [Thermoanaerobaculia bacterium]